jgi:cytidylate kinase
MTVTALCLEMGAFGETFAYEIAAELGVQVLDLRPLELGMAEWHLFCNGAADYGGRSVSHHLQPTPSEIEERSVRVATKIVEAVKGDALVVGWSAAAVLTPLCRVNRVCIRAPRPQRASDVVRRFGDDTGSEGSSSAERPELHLSRFMECTTDPKWLNLDDFDLILDSGCMSAADCQREIVALVKHRWHHTSAVASTEPGRHSAPLSAPERRPPASQNFKGCAVTVGADDVSLTGIGSQEAAIAKIEQHLHGRNEKSAPANPLCRRASD